MAAHWRSRLRIGQGKGVREQGTEPETLVTGQVSGATDCCLAEAPFSGAKSAAFDGEATSFPAVRKRSDSDAIMGIDEPLNIAHGGHRGPA